MTAPSRDVLGFSAVSHVRSATLVFGIVALAACDQPAITEAATPSPATVKAVAGSGASAAKRGEIPLVYFGINNVGSPFDPADGHDHSAQAKDKLVARTVVIEAGGAVQFQIDPFHRVNVYRAGTTFGDIDQSKLIDFVSGPVFIPDFVIDEPVGRVAQSPPFSFMLTQTWTTPPGTFSTPGRYFVMCSFFPHFAFNSMYGWVIVK